MRTYGELSYYGASGQLGMWQIDAEPHVRMRLKRILPRVSVHGAKVRVRATAEIAADLAWVLERWPLEMSDDVERRLRSQAAAYMETRDTVVSILDGHPLRLEGMLEPELTPREYQLTAADVVHATGRLLLTDELGLGKTFSSLLVLRDPDALPALVVTLTHLPAQWVAELKKCLPMLRAHIVTEGQVYNPARRRGQFGHPDVLVINYHKLTGWADHLAGKIRTVIFDEAQELRRGGSLKYEAAAQVAAAATYRMGLTATPVYNYGGEIFNVINVLEPGVLGEPAEFAREWCTGNGEKQSVVDPAALGSYLREEGLMLRRTRLDVGRELPDVQRIPHAIDVDEHVLDEQSAGAEALATMILERTGTNSELFKAAGDFDWRLRHATGLAKAPYVGEFVRMLLETEEPVVLFGWHRDVYDLWAERLADLRPAFFTGEESPTQKREAQQRFLTGDTDLLIMSLRAGAGLDGLQERSRVAVFGELDWSPGVHEQCIGRLNRDGQASPVLAYFLVADDGSDPAIAEVLNLKRMQATGIVDPDAAVLTEHADNHDRVKLLAKEYLDRRRGAA